VTQSSTSGGARSGWPCSHSVRASVIRPAATCSNRECRGMRLHRRGDVGPGTRSTCSRTQACCRGSAAMRRPSRRRRAGPPGRWRVVQPPLPAPAPPRKSPRPWLSDQSARSARMRCSTSPSASAKLSDVLQAAALASSPAPACRPSQPSAAWSCMRRRASAWVASAPSEAIACFTRPSPSCSSESRNQSGSAAMVRATPRPASPDGRKARSRAARSSSVRRAQVASHPAVGRSSHSGAAHANRVR
jgi:hypothetical protein